MHFCNAKRQERATSAVLESRVTLVLCHVDLVLCAGYLYIVYQNRRKWIERRRIKGIKLNFVVLSARCVVTCFCYLRHLSSSIKIFDKCTFLYFIHHSGNLVIMDKLIELILSVNNSRLIYLK